MNKKKLLLLNRRCIKNPIGGGAEIYTHEIFKRLTNEYDIIHFTSSFKEAKKIEIIDNIRYIRKGGEVSVHFFGWLFYLKNNKNFDIIIDQFNGIGFMTFLNKKCILIIYQLYEEFWKVKLGKIGELFRIFEKILLKFYRKKYVITLSESTKKDLINCKFPKEKVSIVENGIDYIKYEKKQKFTHNIGFLGRLEPTKNPEDAYKVFNILKEKIDDLTLHFIGEGSEKKRLQEKYFSCKNCIFHGYVSEKHKYELLRKIDILLVPSIREGWGQIVIQANMVGTPVVGYKVQGIIDSVIDGYSGKLVDAGNVDKMAEEIFSLLMNKEKLKLFSEQALKRSAVFSWDKSAKEMYAFLNKIMYNKRDIE